MYIMGGAMIAWSIATSIRHKIMDTSPNVDPESVDLATNLAGTKGLMMMLMIGITLCLGTIFVAVASFRVIQALMNPTSMATSDRAWRREQRERAERQAEIDEENDKKRREALVKAEERRQAELREAKLDTLPRAAKKLLAKINSLEALITPRELTPRAAMDFRNYIDRELPTALDAYLSLPTKLQSRRDPVLGTPSAVLVDHLSITAAALEKIHDDTYLPAQRTLTTGRDYMADKTGVAAKAEAPAPAATATISVR